jgi:hypothetical protein
MPNTMPVIGELSRYSKMLAPVIARAQELGADNQAIARALKAIAEEFEAAQPGPPDAAS